MNPVQQSLTLVNRREQVFSQLGHLDLVTHPVINAVQQGLTSLNRREPVFSQLGHLDLVTHPDINPLQQGLTSLNRREPVFSYGNSHQVFCYISFSKEQEFSTKFFEESFFCVPNYIIISLQVTSPRTMKTTSLTRIYSNCLQSLIPE